MKIYFFVFILLFSTKCSISQNSIERGLELTRYKSLLKFKGVGYFDNATLLAPFYNESYAGYINQDGKEVCRFNNAITYEFSNGVGVVKQNEQYFIVNKKGLIVKKITKISSLHKFIDGEAVIGETVNGFEKFGILTLKGKRKIKCNYSSIKKISSKFYLVTNNGIGQGVISNNEDTIIPLKYTIDYIDTSSLSFIGFTPQFGFGKFNKNGIPIKLLGKDFYSERIYIEGNHYFQRDSLIIAKNKFTGPDTKFCILNLGLDTIVPLGKYSLIHDINEEYIKFANTTFDSLKNSRLVYGFLNKSGKVVIPPIYDYAHYFTEGFSGVKINNKWGFIDRNSKIVIPLEYDYVLPFRNGFAEAKLNNKKFLIDRKGEKVLEITKHN